MNFPLYNILHEKLQANLQPLSKQEKDRIISKIKQMDNNGYEHLYALIKVHHLEKENEFQLPYNMKLLKMGLRVDIDNLPIELQHIIKGFVDMNP